LNTATIQTLLEQVRETSGALAVAWTSPQGRSAAPSRVPWDAGLGTGGGRVERLGRAATARLPRLVALGARFAAVRAGGEPSGRCRLAFAAAEGLSLSDAAIEALFTALVVLDEQRGRAENAARSAELARLGHAAAGAAHDLRNLLSAALFELEALDAGVPAAGERLRAAFADARELARDFLELESALERRPVELAALVAREAERRGQRVQIEPLREDAGPGRGLWVAGRSDLIARVVANLVANALEASPRAGRVELAAVRAGPCVELSITDLGRGMDQDRLARYLEPGASRSGTGFGTASVRHCLARVGGELWIESAPGAGTRCTLRLLAAPPPGTPAALVYDADPVARWSWREVFERAGWVALDSATPAEAGAWIAGTALVAALAPRGASGTQLLVRAAGERGLRLVRTGVRGASAGVELPRVADRAALELLQRAVGEGCAARAAGSGLPGRQP
jgi:signal transduction histidine kinase